jgi:D-glycero-D-manno-heptose 1,7-bisphosphate phosphatase
MKAVFFDRDDTLMENVPYLGDPGRVRLLPGAPEAIRALELAGFVLFIVTNQSGVGRGLLTPEQVRAVNEETIRQLGHPAFREIYNAFAHPGGNGGHPLSDRKPSPQLLYRAAREHGIDLKRSFFVGDRLGDVLCGRNAGCRTALVRTGENAREWGRAARMADFAADSLPEVAAWIVESSEVTA